VTLESGQPFRFMISLARLEEFITARTTLLPTLYFLWLPVFHRARAQMQSTTGVNAGKQYSTRMFSPSRYSIPGQSGVPPCGPTTAGTTVCDTFETGFGPTGRNVFRAPFQSRWDFSLQKMFKLSERFKLKYELDVFNLFNHASFDAPEQ